MKEITCITENKHFFSEHMKRMTYIRAESIISTFSRGTAGDNADHL